MRLSIIPEAQRKWWTLAAVSFGLFMIMLDNTVVNVALPSIQRDLGADLSELEWIVTGYALTFAALMLIGGKLADAYGRRLIFVIGIVIFTASSLACGLANSEEVLIGARIVQGVGAALMNPATLSIIAATFPPRERGTAIGIWAGVSALALAIGPLVGGLLTEHVGWEWIFFVNIPVGILGDRRQLPPDRRVEGRDARATRPARPLHVRARALRAHVRADRGEHVRLELGADRRLLRRRRRSRSAAFVVLERQQRAPMLDLTALPQRDVHGREPRDAVRRAGDVRRLLLRLALHAEHPRLLGRPGRRGVPADDDPDHPRRADRRDGVGPHRLALADDRRA